MAGNGSYNEDPEDSQTSSSSISVSSSIFCDFLRKISFSSTSILFSDRSCSTSSVRCSSISLKSWFSPSVSFSAFSRSSAKLILDFHLHWWLQIKDIFSYTDESWKNTSAKCLDFPCVARKYSNKRQFMSLQSFNHASLYLFYVFL